jgi:signal transduction histidine kinase
MQAGAFSSSQIQWYYVFSLAITILYGVKAAGFYYIFHTLCLIILRLIIYGDNVIGSPDFIQYLVTSTISLGGIVYFNQLYKTNLAKEAQLQKNAELTEFRRKMLHEINNPLTVIIVIADNYEKSNPSEMNKKLKRNLTRIEEVMARIHDSNNEIQIGNIFIDKEK